MKNRKFQGVLVEFRGGSRAAATSKMECFVIIVNGWKINVMVILRMKFEISRAKEGCIPEQIMHGKRVFLMKTKDLTKFVSRKRDCC